MAKSYGQSQSGKDIVTFDSLQPHLDGLEDDLNDEINKKVSSSDLFDANGKVKSGLLPSFVDDVLEFASRSAFPATGESGKIYIALDTNKTYRWGGSTYVEIAAGLALGETTGTAYEGSKGKANATNIATLLGYFVEGAAKVAAKLSHKITFRGGVVGTFDGSEDKEVTIPSALADLVPDPTHRTVTDAEKAAWDARHEEIVLSVQSLQSQIDSVGSRNNFDEITATSLFSEIVAASKGVFGSIEVLGGIPKSALEASVQTSLGKADTALQSHQAIYSLTIQKNGANIGSYTPNSSSATINIDDVASAALVQEMKKITDLFEISGNDVTLKKNGANARNFIAFGSISAGGAGQGGQGGVGSVTAIELNGVRYSPAEGTTIINLPAYPTKESLYLSNVENKSSATIRSEITSGNITTALGYTPYNASDISSARVAYATTAGSAPASDVYAWAKATNKPSYEYSEIANKPTTLSGYGITDNVAYQGAANDFIYNGNEITMIPSAYSGSLWLNYRTKGGLNGGITDYVFGNGSGGSIISLSTLMSNDDMLAEGIQSLQSQIDAVSSRKDFDELRATVVSSDVVVAQTAYIASIVGNISGNADTASYLVSSSHGVGSVANPVYFSGGRPYACSYSFGNGSGNAALNNGALNTNLYAEKAKDYDADGGISSDFTTVTAALKSLQSQINSVGSRDYSELWEMLTGLKMWIESMFELTSNGIHAKYSLYSSGSITAAA